MDNKERLKGIRQEFIKNCSNLIDELNKIDPQLKSNLNYNITRLIEEFEYLIDTAENHVKVEGIEPLQEGIYQQIRRLGENSSFGIGLSHSDVSDGFINYTEFLNGSNYSGQIQEEAQIINRTTRSRFSNRVTRRGY